MSCNQYVGNYMNRHSRAFVSGDNGPVVVTKPADPEKLANLPKNKRMRGSYFDRNKEKSLYKQRTKQELRALKKFIVA